MKWIIAILILSLLILFHEFGHFLFAKLSGVTVEEFSLGFGPRLISAVKGGTRFSLKVLPFGGSCRMKGMLGSFDEEEDGTGAKEPSEEGSFQSASIGRRASIIFGGPLFNFILAFICAVIVISVVGYDPAEILYVAPGSAAEEAGLKAGDVVLRYNGDRVEIGRDISTWEILHDYSEHEEIRMTVLRDGKKEELQFYPDVVSRYMLGITYSLDSPSAVVEGVQSGSPLEEAGIRPGDVITAIDGSPIESSGDMNRYFEAHQMDGSPVVLTVESGGSSSEITVTPARRDNLSLGFSYNLGRVRISPAGALKYSLIEVRYWITSTVRSLGAMFTGRFSVNDLSGPVGIVDIVGTTYEEAKEEGVLMTWMNMLNLIILLSANLGVMNLLPIPALDGGRLLFLLIEAVRGKPLEQRFELAAQTAAAFLLLLLMVYVMWHDMVNLLQ